MGERGQRGAALRLQGQVRVGHRLAQVGSSRHTQTGPFYAMLLPPPPAHAHAVPPTCLSLCGCVSVIASTRR